MNLEKCNELRFSPRCKRGLVGSADGNSILTTIFAGSRNRFNDDGQPWNSGGKLPTNDQIQALGKELLKERFNDALNSIPNLIYEKNFD